MITVGVGVTDQPFELSLFLEMEDIVDTDVQPAPVGAYVKRTTRERGRKRAMPAGHHFHWRLRDRVRVRRRTRYQTYGVQEQTGITRRPRAFTKRQFATVDANIMET